MVCVCGVEGGLSPCLIAQWRPFWFHSVGGLYNRIRASTPSSTFHLQAPRRRAFAAAVLSGAPLLFLVWRSVRHAPPPPTTHTHTPRQLKAFLFLSWTVQNYHLRISHDLHNGPTALLVCSMQRGGEYSRASYLGRMGAVLLCCKITASIPQACADCLDCSTHGGPRP